MTKESEKIDLSKVAIARKWSGVEWECVHRGISEGDLYRDMRSKRLETDNFFASHETQLESEKQLKRIFGPQTRVMVGETLNRRMLRPEKLVVSLGGDNHKQYVSHFVEDQLTLGVNSDFERSEGGMEYFVPSDMEWLLPRLLSGDYTVEDWARLRAVILRSDGTRFRIPQEAISEIYIGAYARISISKYQTTADGERHKDSGALIALPAGAGEGSWFHSAGGNRETDHSGVPRTEKRAWYLATEVWSGRTLQLGRSMFEITPELTPFSVGYTSYYNGSVSIDPKEGSGRNYRMSRGDKVEIGFSPNPLRVINI